MLAAQMVHRYISGPNMTCKTYFLIDEHRYQQGGPRHRMAFARSGEAAWIHMPMSLLYVSPFFLGGGHLPVVTLLLGQRS